MKLLKLSLLLLVMAWTSTLQAATYYIDYSAGNDANSGLSKTSAWKHSPQMEPFRGNYTHSQGDKFVFKGGVTWPNAALPILITEGGAENNHDYYGVDLSWYAGASWSRPVLDAEKRPLQNHSDNRGNMIWVQKTSHITIDNFEIKNYIWDNPASTSNSDGFCIYVQSSDDVLVKNVYAHNWVVKTQADAKFGGLGGAGSSRTTALNCLIVAPSTVDLAYVTDTGGGRTSGCGIIGFEVIDGCEFVGTTQGIWGGRIIRNNIVRDGQNSFNKGSHENGAWIQNTAEFYNNKFYNIGEGVGVYFLTGWGNRSPHRLNIYNNVFYNTPQINLSPQQNPDQQNEIWFFNNIVQQKSRCIQVGTTKDGAAFGKLVIQNNIFISEYKYEALDVVVAIIDPTDLGRNYINSHNVFYTPTEASALGMRRDNFFKPSQPIPALVDKGVSHSSITTKDMNGSTRPVGSGWDIGAYEIGGAQAVDELPAEPNTLVATTLSVEEVKLSWNDLASNEAGFKIERSVLADSGYKEITSVPTGVTEYLDTGLLPNSTYFYRVRTYNNAGHSDYSNVVSAKTRSDDSIGRLGQPLITPPGGNYLQPVAVVLDSERPGSTIYYTLNGTTPTTNSLRYSTPLTLIQGCTLKAVATEPGWADSIVKVAIFDLDVFTSDSAWENIEFPSSQNETFSMSFDISPEEDRIDAVTGLSDRPSSAYTDLAVIIRFNPAGVIDAINGVGYGAVNPINYSAGKKYGVQLTVDVSSRRYSATITTENGEPVILANNYSFRAQQSLVTALNNIGFIGGDGVHTVSNISFGPRPSPPRGLILR